MARRQPAWMNPLSVQVADVQITLLDKNLEFRNSFCDNINNSTLIDVTKFVLRIGCPEQLMGLLSTFKIEFV